MKFILDEINTGHAIQHYAINQITISGTVYSDSLVLMPNRVFPEWRPDSFEDIQTDDFIQLAALSPEIVVLGTGSKQRFPAHDLIRPLIESQIGFEVMATDAACRTYNILMAEGRRVAAALLMIKE